MSNIFIPFPQQGMSHQRSYWPWWNQVKAVLSVSGTRHHGFLGVVLSQEEFAAYQRRRALPAILLDADVIIHEPLANPGLVFRARYPQREPIPYTDNEEAALRDQFKAATAAYLAESTQLSSLTASLIASISPAVQASAGHPMDGFNSSSLRAIADAMATRYGCLTQEEIEAACDSLDSKWESGRIADHITHHVRTHELLRLNGAPLPEVLKIGHLVKSLAVQDSADSSNAFRAAVQSYYTRVPRVAERTFGTLAADIEIAGSFCSPAAVSVAAVKKKASTPSGSSESERRRVQSGPLVFCSHHGDNRTHVTAHCQELAKRRAAPK